MTWKRLQDRRVPGETARTQTGASESSRRYSRIARRTTCDIDRSSSRARSFSSACISTGSRTTSGCTSSWVVAVAVGVMGTTLARNPAGVVDGDIAAIGQVSGGPPYAPGLCSTVSIAAVAQRTERRCRNHVVVGSNPTGGSPFPGAEDEEGARTSGPLLHVCSLGCARGTPPAQRKRSQVSMGPVSAGLASRSSQLDSAALSRSVRNIARPSSRWLYRQTYSLRYPWSHFGETA